MTSDDHVITLNDPAVTSDTPSEDHIITPDVQMVTCDSLSDDPIIAQSNENESEKSIQEVQESKGAD